MVERCCPSSPRTRPRLAECSWMAGCHAAAAGVASSFRQFNPLTSTSLGRGRDRATPSTQPRRRCSSRLPLSSTPHAARRCPVDSTRRTRLLLLLSVRAARAASAPARCPWPCPPYGTCTQAQCAHPPRLRPRRHPLPRYRLSRVCSQGEACFSTSGIQYDTRGCCSRLTHGRFAAVLEDDIVFEDGRSPGSVDSYPSLVAAAARLVFTARSLLAPPVTLHSPLPPPPHPPPCAQRRFVRRARTNCI